MDENLLTQSPPSESNIRALSIFATYLTTNTLLVLLITNSIFKAYSSRSLDRLKDSNVLYSIFTFSALATLSLAVTWYYMLSFFGLSYHSWAMAHDIPMPGSGTFQQRSSAIHLGPWLKDVQLFRDAWETMVETPARTCWSMPIFFIMTGWALFVAREAPKHKIKHAWAYMVLGQLVAISFAMNLFYVAVLVHPLPEESASKRTGEKLQPSTKVKFMVDDERVLSTLWTPPRSFYSMVLLLTFVSINKTTTSAGSPYFLFFLALPHVLLLLPPIAHIITPRSLGTVHDTRTDHDAFYKSSFEMIITCGFLFEAIALFFALSASPAEELHTHRHSNVHSYAWSKQIAAGEETALQGLWRSLFDHPAVSSVGWDIVLCTASLLVWKLII